MGTRVDFYVGRGEKAEWIGSYPWDGYPAGLPDDVKQATTEASYRNAVAAYLEEGGTQSTLPEHGWPWPWETSHTTDYAYAFDSGAVHASCFGSPWFDPNNEPDQEQYDQLKLTGDRPVFPDMSDRKNVTLGARSGLLVFGVPGGNATG
jgi:hypothetical protein